MTTPRSKVFTAAVSAFAWWAIGTSAYAATAICSGIENDPNTKHLLDSPPAHIEGAESFTYKAIDGVDLKIHVYQPTKAASGRNKAAARPAILFFYSGAWEYGTVKEFIEPAKYFSKRGAVAILVDYRVFCRNGNSIADEISDAKSAVRYVRSHAKALGIDANRIVASGASAGGHLALSTATIDGFESAHEDISISSKPNFLALFYPCSDVTTEEEKMYGGDAIGNYGREVSPLFHIRKGLPPTLIMQGTDDIVYEENKQFCAASKALSNSCEIVIYKNASHGFFGPDVDNGKWYKLGLAKMDSALTKAGYLHRK